VACVAILVAGRRRPRLAPGARDAEVGDGALPEVVLEAPAVAPLTGLRPVLAALGVAAVAFVFAGPLAAVAGAAATLLGASVPRTWILRVVVPPVLIGVARLADEPALAWAALAVVAADLAVRRLQGSGRGAVEGGRGDGERAGSRDRLPERADQ
jgi:hypothetical protein